MQLLESLNTLRHKGAELLAEGDQDNEDESDGEEITLLEQILISTDDEEDKLTHMIETLMDAQEEARACGGAQHATIHVVNRCCQAAKRKRECLMLLREGLETIEAADQWDRDIAGFRALLNKTINPCTPTLPRHAMTPDHTLALRAKQFLQKALDDRVHAIIAFAGTTDSADKVDQLVTEALKAVKIRLIPPIAEGLMDLSKDHPRILEAKKLANDLREGERMRQRRAAQEKKQAELRAKQAAEQRVKERAEKAAAEKAAAAS